MLMIIQEKSTSFVFNKSKYSRDSRKIRKDSKCIKNAEKTQNALKNALKNAEKTQNA